ncbi:MAG: spore germination protein [Oscillospiraceae bacterium]|nr:spore germination protein [Oscillospiraceae bacterium]
MSRTGIFRRNKCGGDVPPPYHPPEKSGTAPVSAAELKKMFAHCADFELRPIWPGLRETADAAVCWLDGLVSGTRVSEDVLRPLTDALRLGAVENAAGDVERLLRGAVWSCSVKRHEALDDVVNALLRGSCAVVFDHTHCAVTFETKTEATRSVSAPMMEKTIKGAKDAFVETLRTNSSLVRRKLRSAELKLEQTTVGRKSSTEVAILYYNGIVNPNTLAQLRARLDAIDIDGLMSAGNLEQYIVERPKSLFPQLLHTERPDKFAAELLSGRIGILVDGLPLGFLLPATLAGFLHTAEDRAQNFLTASALLLLRWLSLLISALLPALFVAVAMYHQEMIPTQLLLSMIDAKQQVPFSVALEVLIMLVAFELLMEVGVRLPDPVGDTVSIIGALIVGQSAVDARVVSPITVIIVATTAICGFTQPSRDLDAALRALRLGMVFLAIFLGLFGIMLGMAAALWYLCTLESFGVPYVAPFAEGGFRETLNALLRTPLPTDKMREAALRTPDKRRQK